MEIAHKTILKEKLIAFELFDKELNEGFGYPVHYTEAEARKKQATISYRYELRLWEEI